MDTKLVGTMDINRDAVNDLFRDYMETKVTEVLDNLKMLMDQVLLPAIDRLVNQRWVYMNNFSVIYDHEVVALFPDLLEFRCEFSSTVTTTSLFFADYYQGELMTLDEVKKAFNRRIEFPFKVGENKINYDGDESNASYRMTYQKDDGTLGAFDMDDESLRTSTGVHMPIYRLNGKNSAKVQTVFAMFLWIQGTLVPNGLDNIEQKYYDDLVLLSEYMSFKAGNILYDSEQLIEDIMDDRFCEEILDFNFNKKIFIENLYSGKQSLIAKNHFTYERLLQCDEIRADIDAYDEKMLTDPNRGHWDLWTMEQPEDGEVRVELSKGLIARNPVTDIRSDGVIGIDFGTKSTVVVHQEDSEHTLPMRVGMGQFSKKIEAKHYENPTVMEFIDLKKFIEAYLAKRARPLTAWEDVTVSHTAFQSLMSSNSEQYYTHLSELKQWAGDHKRQIRLKDKQGHDVILTAFKNLGESDINPIELYAYYIGLFINNQHNGIYLNYALSFPVTYEKAIQEKIVESFRRGLLKSLPIALHNDLEAKEAFRVSIGASEPAAYAVCALQEYGLNPQDDEVIFYGIFDFGGGTTDFDFGIWREAGPKERRYDYVIEHFGAGGDRYLGGENLLELLAFEVFKANQDKLRDTNISFLLPPECHKFAGSELLLTDSQESKINMKQLMEKLRPLWERHEGYEKEFDKGLIKVNLFDKSGRSKPNFELGISIEGLEQVLLHRIEKGIRNFFESLRRSFDNPAITDVNKVHIFLAGNSSKSPLVRELFEKYMASETASISTTSRTLTQEYFEIFPPLGMEEAYAKQQERGIVVNRDVIEQPTGKTGVAFGLVRSRKGGKIKVVDRNVIQDEVKFKYYLGIERRGTFRVVIDRDEHYGIWHNFIDASEEDFEIYFTSLPESTRNQLTIKDVQRKKCRIDQTDDSACVFIRTVSPTEIEYVVATEDQIESNRELGSIIKRVELAIGR